MGNPQCITKCITYCITYCITLARRVSMGPLISEMYCGSARMAAYNARTFGGGARVCYLLEAVREPALPFACSCAR